jgi:hypothetical protein
MVFKSLAGIWENHLAGMGENYAYRNVIVVGRLLIWPDVDHQLDHSVDVTLGWLMSK